MTHTGKILLLGTTLTILALLVFQPGIIGGYKPHRTPEVRLRSRPAFFQVDLGPVFTPHIPSTTTSTTTTVAQRPPPQRLPFHKKSSAAHGE